MRCAAEKDKAEHTRKNLSIQIGILVSFAMMELLNDFIAEASALADGRPPPPAVKKTSIDRYNEAYKKISAARVFAEQALGEKDLWIISAGATMVDIYRLTYEESPEER